MSYTYYVVDGPLPSGKTFRKRVKRTRGQYYGTTQPTGTFGFRYAVFRNVHSEWLIPTHDLTPETRAAIEGLPNQLDSALLTV